MSIDLDSKFVHLTILFIYLLDLCNIINILKCMILIELCDQNKYFRFVNNIIITIDMHLKTIKSIR